jgi:hypothetical protein
VPALQRRRLVAPCKRVLAAVRETAPALAAPAFLFLGFLFKFCQPEG